MPSRFDRVFKAGAIVVLVVGLLTIWIGMSDSYFRSPKNFVNYWTRTVAGQLLAILYRADIEKAKDIARGYEIGAPDLLNSSATASWRKLQQTLPGFRLKEIDDSRERAYAIPFIYQRPDAPYLREFRSRYDLDRVISGARDEYDAMLRLGGWLGAKWDHGTDEVPGGNLVCDPSAVIDAGEHGAKYWCEIAAKTAVQAATALGWPARLTTASRDGHTWEHAVAELWSNQFGKWFAMDTDFNIVYEADGIPLSAFELSREGEQLQRNGRLRARPIAPPKLSLVFQDLVPFYAYVHVDMRNDWCTRSLRRGSPAGGDLATWWTARPTFHRILTQKIRIDDAAKFDWVVNSTDIHVMGAERSGNGPLLLKIGFTGYSPMFERFEVQLDGQNWENVKGAIRSLSVGPGTHTIAGRLVTSSGSYGPPTRIKFEEKSSTATDAGATHPN